MSTSGVQPILVTGAAMFDALAETYPMTYIGHKRDIKHFVDTAAPVDGENVLDLCCGTGFITLEIMSRLKSGTCVAVDYSRRSLAVLEAGQNHLAATRQDGGTPQLLMIHGDVTEAAILDQARISLPKDASGFDLITCSLGIQILHGSVEAHLRLWSTYLAPGGRIVIDSPFMAEDHYLRDPIKIESRLHNRQERAQLHGNPVASALYESNLASNETVTLWLAANGTGPQESVIVCSAEATRLAHASGLDVVLIKPAHIRLDTDIDISDIIQAATIDSWHALDVIDQPGAYGKIWTAALKNNTEVSMWPFFVMDQRRRFADEYIRRLRQVPGLRAYDSTRDAIFCQHTSATIIIVMKKTAQGGAVGGKVLRDEADQSQVIEGKTAQ